MNSIQSKFVSFLVIIQLVSFNAMFGMQNQQPQPARPGLGSRIGAALGGGVGAAIDHGVVRLWDWITDADYTVGTIACRGLALPCIAAASVYTCKAIYNGFQMSALYGSAFLAPERNTANRMQEVSKNFMKNSGCAFAATIAALYLTNNPQRA